MFYINNKTKEYREITTKPIIRQLKITTNICKDKSLYGV